MTITTTKSEAKVGELTSQHLNQAVSAFGEDGYLIIEDAVNHEPLDILRKKMSEDSRKLISAEKWGGAGRVRGHLQQGPPPNTPFIFPEIVSNPIAIQFTKAVLGDGQFNSFYDGNTNTPGSGLQPVHRDQQPLWPGWEGDHPTTTIVVNISPLTVRADNGSTEIWPGSHKVPGELTETMIAEQSERKAPLRVEAKKGSLVFRDIRLWHRGVPNESDELRHMIALVHQIRWYHRRTSLQYQKGCEDAFVSEDLDHNAIFVDEPIDYLFQRPQGHT